MNWSRDLPFDWDDANVGHISRHGIAASEVEQILGNDSTDLRYEQIDDEDRWTSIGHTDQLRILIVVWTMRGEAIRPITAFGAGKSVAVEYLSRKGL